MQIVDSDAFLEMKPSAQALYFQLVMRADDDGFVNSPKRIARLIGATQKDLDALIEKRFLLFFKSGIVCIKHWRLQNTLRRDRYKPTVYKEELDSLAVKENGIYTEKTEGDTGNQLATERQPFGNQMAAQYSEGKSNLVEDSLGYTTTTTTDISLYSAPAHAREEAEPPTLGEVVAYFREEQWLDEPGKEAEKFFAYNAYHNWDCLPEWKRAADLWAARIEDYKK